MMRSLVTSSLKFRRLVVALAAGLLVFGVVQLRHQTVDQLPEFSPTMVEVRTEALGLSAAEVEQLITVPLEQDLLNGIPFLDDIYSESVPGLSSVVMIFEPGTPLLDARQVVAEKVAEAAVALPGVSTPPRMLQPLSSTSRVVMARLSSDTLSPIELSVLARWVIVPRLLGVHGVSNISVFGQRDRQLQVRVDPQRLRDAGISLQQVVSTTGNALWVSPLTFLEASTPGTAGFIDTPNQRFTIRHILPVRTAEDLAQIPIEDEEGNAVPTNGEPLRLGDVTDVLEDHQPLIGDALFADRSGLLLVVEKFPGEGTVEVTRGVEEAFDAMRPGLPGVRIDTSFFRPAASVERAADTFFRSLVIGAILLLLALALLFFEWRQILVCAIAILASAAVAALVLYLRGAPINALVLAGLVTGLVIVVDDAVVDSWNLAARLHHHREEEGGGPLWGVLVDASLEMRSSLLFATLIVALATLPMFFLQGEAGAFLPPLAVSYLLAVAASMVVALTLTPALGMMLLARSPAQRRVSPAVGRLQLGHERILSGSLGRPTTAYAAVAVVALLGVIALPFLDRSSAVRLQESDLLIRWDAAPGTSLPAMSGVTSAAVDELRSLPGVRTVSAHVGRAIDSDQVVGINSGQIWVSLDPSADRDAAIAGIDRVLAGYPEMASDVLTYPEDRIADVLRGTDEDVVVRLYGANAEALRSKAEEVRGLLAGIDGIVRPTIETTPTEPTIEVEVDLREAQRFAVKPGDVRRASAILLSGLTVGNLFEEQKVFDVVVWGTPEIRQDLADVRNLPIDTPTGDQIRLAQVADVRVVPNPTVFRHESVSNYLDVSASVSGRDAGAVVDDVERALATIDFPLEHHAEIRGAYATERASRVRILAVVVAAAIGILLLLQAAFASWRLAILVFATLPLAVVGGLLAAMLGGRTLTLGSYAGLVAVVGIAARNAVLLLRRYRRLEGEGSAFGPELVVGGIRDRFVPILVTAVGTAVAVLPFVAAGDVAGMEFARPMAIVLLGGLVTSTLVALVILPGLYARHGWHARAPEEELVVVPEAQPEPQLEVRVEPVRGS